MKHTIRSQEGFTLVELLIVVAIIGILATVGIPAYRLAMQASKMSEAQVELGGLWSAEQAFMSEYGGYGNRLDTYGIGFNIDSQAPIYNIGFQNAGCADLGSSNLLPANPGAGNIGTDPVASNVYNGLPNYWNTNSTLTINVKGTQSPVFTINGNGNFTGCLAASSFANIANIILPNGNKIVVNPGYFNVFGSGGANEQDFIASAQGVISPRANPITGQITAGSGNTGGSQANAAIGNVYVDVWAMLDTKQLMHLQDGRF